MDPIPIKKDIISILQRFFKQDPEFTYKDDQDKTGIVIADIYGVDRKNVEKYPAVLLARGNTQYTQLCLGDFVSSSNSARSAPQPSDGYECQVNGALVCQCVSYEGVEAERIATRVAMFLQMTKREIGKHLHIKIQNIAIGAESTLKDWPPGLVSVPVNFDYSYNVAWKITDMDTIIRGSITT